MSVVLGLLGVGLVVATSIAIYRQVFSAPAKAKRALSARPPRRIADVEDGAVVKIVGKVELLEAPLVSPIAQRECAFYEAFVEEELGDENGSNWTQRIAERYARNFVVREGSSKAVVDVSGATFAIVADVHTRSGFLNDATPELEVFLRKYDQESTGLLGFNRTFRYREGAIEAGEIVSVLGRARWERDPDVESVGYRDTKKRLVIEAPPDGTVIVSDDPQTFG
jgi:hypothetical protein